MSIFLGLLALVYLLGMLAGLCLALVSVFDDDIDEARLAASLLKGGLLVWPLLLAKAVANRIREVEHR